MEEAKKRWTVGWAFIVIALLWGLFTVPQAIEFQCRNCLFGHTHQVSTGSSDFSLKTIASAQADFCGNDRDGNGVQDFWRDDISGLYGVVPAGSTQMIRLIQVSGAGADVSPFGHLKPGAVGPGEVYWNFYTAPAPKAGYWYLALRHADEIPGALDPKRFAACAYPADYPKSGRMTYITSEGNTIFCRDLGRPGPPDVFPDDAALQRDWKKLD